MADGALPASFEGLKSHIDRGWIESTLAKTGTATVRRRKLPAEQVVGLVVGIALYRDQPISEIVDRLDLVLPDKEGKKQRVTNTAVIGARDRIGSAPLEDLFRTTARHWALDSADRHRWRGLMVLGGDGTTMRVPDSAANRDEFGLPRSSRRSAGYPQIRAVGLMVLRSHLLLDFAFAGCTTGEVSLACPLTRNVPLARGIRRRMPDIFFLKKFGRCPCIDLTFFVAVVADGSAVRIKIGASSPCAVGAPNISASFASVLAPN